jgi:hypothetical protein
LANLQLLGLKTPRKGDKNGLSKRKERSIKSSYKRKNSNILFAEIALVAILIGVAIGNAFESTGAMITLGTIGFLIGLGAHISGLEWAQDIANSSQDNQ